MFFFAIFNPVPSYSLLLVSNSFVFQCVFDVMVFVAIIFVAIIFVECHHLFAYPGKMLIKSSQIGHNWVARCLRSIKLQFHVLTLLLHWIEMNTNLVLPSELKNGQKLNTEEKRVKTTVSVIRNKINSKLLNSSRSNYFTSYFTCN